MTSKKCAHMALIGEPYFVGGVLLEPLSFGKTYILCEIGADTPIDAKSLLVAISIAKAKNYNKAVKTWRDWVMKPHRSYLRWIRVAHRVKKHFDIVRKTWSDFFNHSTNHPVLSGGNVRLAGHDVLYAIRASLLVSGTYTHDEIMNAPFQRILLDFAYQQDIDVWDENKQAGLEALKAAEKETEGE